MKILLTGSIQVGKTTLLNRLAGMDISGVICVSEVARDIMNRSPESFVVPGKPEVFPNMGDVIFNEQVRRETRAEKSGAKVILCDRGSLDIITHTVLFGGAINPEWKDRISSYDQIFLFNKNDVPFDSSSYPPGRDWAKFRDDLDVVTKSVLADYSLSYDILSGTEQTRAETVQAFILNKTSPEGNRFRPEGGVFRGKERH